MKTLELKYLAPYIDCKLNVKIVDFNRNYKVGKIYEMSLQLLHDKFKGSQNNNIFKPILRPLSDLTKEIEVNGEKFVPLKYIYGNDFTPNDDFFENMDTLSIGYREMLLLFEWHFDVFGLIPEELAININTL